LGDGKIDAQNGDISHCPHNIDGRWLVFSSKANSDYTQLFLTHIDEQGQSDPAVLLEHFTCTASPAGDELCKAAQIPRSGSIIQQGPPTRR
jgi:hypothetical protein